jgi:hypothetical protein
MEYIYLLDADKTERFEKLTRWYSNLIRKEHNQHHKMAQDTIRKLKMIIEVGTGAAYRYRFFEKMRARRDLDKN